MFQISYTFNNKNKNISDSYALWLTLILVTMQHYGYINVSAFLLFSPLALYMGLWIILLAAVLVFKFFNKK